MSHTPLFETENSIDESLQLLRQCPLCQASYQTGDLTVIEDYDDVRLVHMTCGECASAVMAIVVVSPLGMSSVAVFTDLTAGDVSRLRSRDIFNQDDVLDFYSGMQKSGGLEALLVQHEQLSKTFS